MNVSGGADPLSAALDRADRAGRAGRAVVLVEGGSDRVALETLARRRDRDLDAEGVTIVAITGASSFARFLALLGPRGHDVPVVGMCDAAEERDLRRGRCIAGFEDDGVEGVHVCVADLEDELIRALGVPRVLEVVASAGDARALRTMQAQPAQRGRPVTAQLRRFLGAGSGRKRRYAEALVAALDLDRVPAPLDAVLDAVPPSGP